MLCYICSGETKKPKGDPMDKMQAWLFYKQTLERYVEASTAGKDLPLIHHLAGVLQKTESMLEIVDPIPHANSLKVNQYRPDVVRRAFEEK